MKIFKGTSSLSGFRVLRLKTMDVEVQKLERIEDEWKLEWKLGSMS